MPSWIAETRQRREKPQNAMEAASKLSGTVAVGDTFSDIRFNLADEVLVRFFGDEVEAEDLMDRLQEGVVALWRLTRAAFELRLTELDNAGAPPTTDGGGPHRATRPPAQWRARRRASAAPTAERTD